MRNHQETRAAGAATLDRPGPAVQEYLDHFATALTAGDGKTIATMWGVPALVVSDQGARAVSTLKEVELFFGGAKEQYHARGVTDTRAEIQRLEWASDRLAIVDVRWPWIDNSGKERGEESSTYTLRVDELGKLKMHVAVMHGARP